MHSLIDRPSPAGGILLGSRPSAAGMLHLSAGGVPESQRPDLLREFFDRLGVRYDAELMGRDPIEIDLTLQGLPGLQLLSGKLHGARFRRTRENTDPTEDVGLVVNSGGEHFMRHQGREIVLGDGDATLISLTDTLETVNRPPGEILVLRFPRPQLAPRLSGAQDCILRRIPHESPALRLLTNYVRTASQEQALADPDLQRVVVSHLYDLTALAIGATRDATELAQGRGLRAARLHAIKQHIAGNLDQPDLSVAALAARHSCTERFIQRLFESEGTSFTDYLLAQRVALAYRMLTDPRREGDKISTIAFDAGFGDVSYFNRVFRQHFGDTPSDVRARSRCGN
jgi:AraC-like DNA-binding protein